MGTWKRTPILLALLTLVGVACNASGQATITLPPSQAPPTATSFVATPVMPSPSRTATAFFTATVEPAPTGTPTPTPSDTPTSPTVTPLAILTPTFAGPGCLSPPDDYARVEVNGETLNARTLWMLQQAAALYDGPGDLLRVTQGSYTSDEATSFGTHTGGGAVDISIRDPADPNQVLWEETDAMVLALRRAGFAAWYRAPGDLGSGSPAHIHAVAIGDRELSAAAIEQLVGPGGYFRGLDGLPPGYGGPHPDPLGGPVICPWMLALGYQDLRE
jgi:hypothetical protein